jgi:Peptidase family M23
MTKKIITMVAYLSLCSFSKPYFVVENNYPRDFFASPVNHSIEVTGTFGELRPNHFHGGIDIRPDRSGVSEPIFASADGYISRIAVSAYGYGKMLQITHANGYTTLYGHLDDFSSDLNEYAKANQYANESFEVSLTPNVGSFFVKKGQQIGIMGNTGGSQGTHLHFEIRETSTGKGLNPLLFGFNVPDDKSPKFYEMKIYSLDNEHNMVSSREINLRPKGKTTKIKVKKGKKTKYKTIYTPPPAGSPYTIESDTIDVNADNIGLAIKTFDTANWSDNTNGVYELSLYQDENLVYNFNVEKIDFEETRYINAHIDYREKSSGGGYFNRCYRLPGNQLSAYTNLQNDGVLTLYPQQISEVMIVAKDANLNPDTLTFYLRRGNATVTSTERSFAKKMSYNADNQFDSNGFSASFPYGCFYETFNLSFDQSTSSNNLVFSPLYRLHQSATPVHSSFEVKIQPNKPIPDSLQGKLFIGFKENDGDISFCGNTWQGDFLVGKNNVFGTYMMMADTTAPSIKAVRFSENMQNESRMSFRVSDNIKTGKNGLRWRASVDNQWILLENDVKSPTLTHHFDGRIASGEHELVIEAEDKCGNKTVFRKKFVR